MSDYKLTTEELWLELGRAFRAHAIELPMQEEDRRKTSAGICYAVAYGRSFSDPIYKIMQEQLEAFLERHPEFDFDSGYLFDDYGHDKLTRAQICLQLAREAVEKGL